MSRTKADSRVRLLQAAARRRLLLQIAIRMEDERVHHPSIIAPVVSTSRLREILLHGRSDASHSSTE